MPGHARALLLLERARQAHLPPAPAPDAFAEALQDACARDGAASPVIAAACDLASAVAARAAGERSRALERALAAAGKTVVEARVEARIALTLAQLGRIDEADRHATIAARTAAVEMPPLAWARLAIALGRGELTLLPRALLPACLETRLVAARTALAGGGPRRLGAYLADLGPGALAADADLRALSLLVAPRPDAAAGEAPAPTGTSSGALPTGTSSGELPTGPSPGTPPAGPSGAPPRSPTARSLALPGSPLAPLAPSDASNPVHAYAQGLRARLEGDAAGAAHWLSAALDGHGDACRAAGEYVAAARLAGQTVTNQLDPVRAVNGRCLNLTLPPAQPPRRPRNKTPRPPGTAR